MHNYLNQDIVKCHSFGELEWNANKKKCRVESIGELLKHVMKGTVQEYIHPETNHK